MQVFKRRVGEGITIGNISLVVVGIQSLERDGRGYQVSVRFSFPDQIWIKTKSERVFSKPRQTVGTEEISLRNEQWVYLSKSGRFCWDDLVTVSPGIMKSRKADICICAPSYIPVDRTRSAAGEQVD